MSQIPTKEELQNFVLNFDNAIVKPLVQAGFNRYNIFDILNISRQELRHSDFLAFLMDSKRSGNIGEQFLKNFLVMLAKDVVSDKLDFFTMFYGNIEKVDVWREVVVSDGRLDIIADIEIVKDCTQKILIVIENKVDSTQHDNQLMRYQIYLQKKYNKHNIIMLYLSPVEENFDDNIQWTGITYSFIYNVLDRIDIELADNTLRLLIEDYKSKIRREFAMNIDDELKQMAVEIYKNEFNRKVLDYIFSCRPYWLSETAKIFHNQLEKYGVKFVTLKVDAKFISFRTDNLPENYYLQINVGDLSLLLCDFSTNRRAVSQRWLMGSKHESEKTVKLLKELVYDNDQLKATCEQIIDNIFETDGLINQCITELNNKID